MAEYYFDIETYGTGEKPNPDKDKIITIQFQKIDLRTGKAIGELEILKEWESSEKEIVERFFKRFFADEYVWDFVAVGFNLNFEWEFLIAKFEKYIAGKFTSKDFHYSIPQVDLKPLVVLLNKGNFKGATLGKFTNKSQSGGIIKSYYENKQFEEIEKYIAEEANAYLDFLQKINSNIGKLIE